MWSEVEEDMLATLLPFHRRIVEELIKEDGLCILSSGMGWQKVVRLPFQCQLFTHKQSYSAERQARLELVRFISPKSLCADIQRH